MPVRLPSALIVSRTRLGGLALALALLISSALPSGAWATNGYFSNGYGAKSEGAGGTGIAWAQDALAAAANPAGTAEVGNRIDLGLDWFIPRRGAQIEGNAFGASASYDGSAKANFFIPSFGYTKRISDTLAAGVAVFGNGGMDTLYNSNPYARFGASGPAGVELEQLFITPSVSWKVAPGQNLGLGVNLAYQRFLAQGIGFFGGFSGAPNNVSDLGVDTSYGAGLRLGWSGTIAPGLTAGATWASRIRGNFSKYKGLFADGGRFDVPDNFGLGLVFAPSAQWKIAADWQRINYAHVASVGDPLAALLRGVPLGASNGPGFGWQNINVFKLGASFALDPAWTVRAGYSHAGQAVPASQTFFNILAPGVVSDHFTLGGSWAPNARGEWSAFFAYAPEKTVNGNASIPPGYPPGGFGGGEANVHLKEAILGVSYAWKL